MLKKLVFIAMNKFTKPFYGTGILVKHKSLARLYRLVHRLTNPRYIVFQNCKFFLDKNDSLEIATGNNNEIFEINLMKKLLKQGDNVVDVGAHIGLYTVLAAKIIGKKGKVFSFEPEKSNFSLLMKNITANSLGNVRAHRLALGKARGKVKLFVDEENSGSSGLNRTKINQHSQMVTMETLDNLLKNQKINFIKIDVEGYEHFVLSGAKKILKKNNEIVIFSEFFPKKLKESGSSAENYFRFIFENGLKVFLIDEDKNCLRKIKDMKEINFGLKGFCNLLLSKETETKRN